MNILIVKFEPMAKIRAGQDPWILNLVLILGMGDTFKNNTE